MNGQARYTGGEYLQHNPDWHDADAPWKAAQIVALLREQGVAGPSLRRIADIGCGAGGVLDAVSRALGGDTACEGFDISPQAIVLAGARQRPGLVFHQRDLLADDGPPHDLVLAIDVFEHVEDYIGFLRRLRERGRQFVFHIPLELSAQMVARGAPLMHARRVVGHLHHFNKDTALATLQHCDYEVAAWRYTAGALELPAAHLQARVLRGPRKLLFALNADLAVRLLGGFSLLVLARPQAGAERKP